MRLGFVGSMRIDSSNPVPPLPIRQRDRTWRRQSFARADANNYARDKEPFMPRHLSFAWIWTSRARPLLLLMYSRFAAKSKPPVFLDPSSTPAFGRNASYGCGAKTRIAQPLARGSRLSELQRQA